MTDETESFHDSFVRLNANLEFISGQFADVVRNLMRASVASDPSAAIYRAAEGMNSVAELLSKTEEKFGFHALFSKAIEHLHDEDEPERGVERAIVHAAQSRVKYLVERSCDDNAARGRTSRREQEFLSAIRWIEQAQEENRRKWDRR